MRFFRDKARCCGPYRRVFVTMGLEAMRSPVPADCVGAGVALLSMRTRVKTGTLLAGSAALGIALTYAGWMGGP